MKKISIFFLITILLFNIPFIYCENGFAYSSTFAIFTINADATWTDYDLFTNKGVPKGAIAEIVCANKNTGDEAVIGIRTDGSIIQRKIDIHEAEGDGVTTVTMLVKCDSNTGKIECYAQVAVDVEFYLLGYFENCNFNEEFIDLGWPSVTWDDVDLSTYGVPSNAVIQIMQIIRCSACGWFYTGIRANGSSLNRKVPLDEAEGVPVSSNVISMFVKTDANGIIEWIAGAGYARGQDYILGWFSPNVDFIEAYTSVTFASSRDDGVWQSRTLTEPEANSVVAFALMHLDSGSETYCGLREEGGSQARMIEEHEAEGGGGSGFEVCVNVDANKKLEIYCADASESYFRYMGYFKLIVVDEAISVWYRNFMLIFLLSISSIWLYGVSRRTKVYSRK